MRLSSATNYVYFNHSILPPFSRSKKMVVKRTSLPFDNGVSHKPTFRDYPAVKMDAAYSAVGDTKVELKKRINLFHCVSIIIGIIIGAGIFVSPVGITSQVNSVGMTNHGVFKSLFVNYWDSLLNRYKLSWKVNKYLNKNKKRGKTIS